MNITLDYRNPTPAHCDVAVFLDHALVGVLTLRQEDLATFQHIILHGMRENRDTFLGTGDPEPPGAEPLPERHAREVPR